MSAQEDGYGSYYEPEYEPESVQVGDKISLELLCVVRKCVHELR